VLADPHDAQDAFQATFLVLIKKARGLWVRDSLGPWLHQVAYRTAACARATAERRRRHERHAARLAAVSFTTNEDGLDREWEQLLHAEIERLPEHYRVPIVLCDLEGRSHEQAARHMGWAIGTVKSRHSRGRERLRDRLRRRGLAPDTCLLATALQSAGPDELIVQSLVRSTTGAAVEFVPAKTLAKGFAFALAREVLKAMSLSRWLKVGSMLLALGATATGVGFLAQNGALGVEPRPDDPPKVDRAEGMAVFPVKSGRFEVTVVDRGYVETNHSEDVHSEIEGQSTIMKLLPEGTRVKTGQIVCELDSSALKDKLVNQEIAKRAAESAYQLAKLSREAAEIAVSEFVQGIFKRDQKALMGEIAEAHTVIRKGEARLERTRRARQRMTEALAPKGEARSAAEIVAELDIEDHVDAAEQNLERAGRSLELAKLKQLILETYTKDKTIKRLTVELEQCRAHELAKQAAWDLEKSKEAKLNRQIEKAIIRAPADGIIVYASIPAGLGGQYQMKIEEGASVRERQKIFSIPDLSDLRINTKVREAWIDRIKRGQRVRIKVDAFPDQALTGEVVSVQPLPDRASPFNPRVKVYTTLVKVQNALQGLRPGLTAESEIVISELDNVLTVPVEAVITYDLKEHVAVKKADGGFEWREVTLGASDGKLVEIKQGITSGESVALNPGALRPKEEKRGSPPITKPAEAPRAEAPNGEALKEAN
jgi:HlyD family secretion protein